MCSVEFILLLHNIFDSCMCSSINIVQYYIFYVRGPKTHNFFLIEVDVLRHYSKLICSYQFAFVYFLLYLFWEDFDLRISNFYYISKNNILLICLRIEKMAHPPLIFYSDVLLLPWTFYFWNFVTPNPLFGLLLRIVS